MRGRRWSSLGKSVVGGVINISDDIGVGSDLRVCCPIFVPSR